MYREYRKCVHGFDGETRSDHSKYLRVDVKQVLKKRDCMTWAGLI